MRPSEHQTWYVVGHCGTVQTICLWQTADDVMTVSPCDWCQRTPQAEADNLLASAQKAKVPAFGNGLGNDGTNCAQCTSKSRKAMAQKLNHHLNWSSLVSAQRGPSRRLTVQQWRASLFHRCGALIWQALAEEEHERTQQLQLEAKRAEARLTVCRAVTCCNIL